MKNNGFDQMNMGELNYLYNTGITNPYISQIMRMKLNHVFVNAMSFTKSGNLLKCSESLRNSWETQMKIIVRYMWCIGFGASINKRESKRLRFIEQIVRTSKSLNEVWKRIGEKYKIKEIVSNNYVVSDLNFLRDWKANGAEPDDGLWKEKNSKKEEKSMSFDEQQEEDSLFFEALNISNLVVYIQDSWSNQYIKHVFFVPMRLDNNKTVFVRIRNVFILKDDTINTNGIGVISRVSLLLPKLELDKKTNQYLEVSMRSRAIPNIPFEADSKHKNDWEPDVEVQNRLDSNQREAINLFNRDGFRENDALNMPIPHSNMHDEDSNLPSNVYKVPKGLKVSKQQEAHEPTNLLNIQSDLITSVFNVFEVPIGLMSIYSLYLSKDQGLLGKTAGKTFSIDSIHYVLWEQGKDSLSDFMIKYIMDCIGHSTINPVSWDAIKDIDVDQIEQVDVDQNFIVVTMPKILELDKLISLVSSGYMKFEPGMEQVAKRLRIDRNVLTDKMPKDVEQLVGIKKEQPVQAKPSKKRKR